MACNSMSISSSSITKGTTKDIFRGPMNLRRTSSGNDLYTGGRIRRSYSDHFLCYSTNRIRASSTKPKLKSSRSTGKFPFKISSSILPNPIKSFLFEPETREETKKEERKRERENEEEEGERKRANWVERLLEIRCHWRNKQQRDDDDDNDHEDGEDDENEDGLCEVDYNDDDEKNDEIDTETINQESFSRLLSEVDWSDTKLFSRLAYLCNMAYVIPDLKAKDLRRNYRLRLVTSSLEKKAEAATLKAKLEQDSTCVPILPLPQKKHLTQPSVAYEIAASAASYVQSSTKGLLCLSAEHQQEERKNLERESCSGRVYNSEVAAYVAASTMTAVVAAGEKAKLEAARDLQSLHSSPCEWFVCDDFSTYTRCFIIQGSDSLASWHANLFFEPTKFEGTDVLVHRGIYEAAKGIYEQFMPEIIDHLNTFGDRAKLQFTGHSLGGSLALLINLMLLSRKVVTPSELRPVVTFGSPFVFCGGQRILDELGLDQDHIQCVMMHRDVVPRAFSCNYPDYVAQLLKRLSGTFRSHPCLNKNKLLYSPMGKIFILQPDESSSPPHPLLPPGSALYALEKTQIGPAAISLRTFLNSPHPLETLSDPTAYGSEGTILRDHDSKNYLKAINGVLRQHTKMVVRKVGKERDVSWPILASSPTQQTWVHKGDLENPRLLGKEVMTSVVKSRA